MQMIGVSKALISRGHSKDSKDELIAVPDESPRIIPTVNPEGSKEKLPLLLRKASPIEHLLRQSFEEHSSDE